MSLRPVLLVALALVLTWACCTEALSASADQHSIRIKRESTVQSDPLAKIAEGALCGKSADEICSLPGASNLHVRMRAGYITVDKSHERRLWYLIADHEGSTTSAEAATSTADNSSSRPQGEGQQRRAGGDQEEQDEEEAPVLLWLTGGPGCSSLDAFIYEHGPFLFSYGEGAEANGKRRVVLRPNPYSYTKLATVIYVDSPAGAGLSYSMRPESDYHTNDERTTQDLVVFLEGLVERYPEIGQRRFFISGESYGGVYVPFLAQALVEANRRREQQGRPRLVDLQGYAIGNPVTDDVVDGNAQLHFAADMGFLDPDTWRQLQRVCKQNTWNADRGTECWDLVRAAKDRLDDMNHYSVLEPCTRDDSDDEDDDDDKLQQSGRRTAAGSVHGAESDAARERLMYWPYTVRMEFPPGRQGGEGGRRLWGPWLRHTAPCMDRRIALDWVNRPEVRAALHGEPASKIGEWQPCSDVLYYRLDTAYLVPVHEQLIMEEGLRALLYSGDHDMVVPHTGTRMWLYDEQDRFGGPTGPLQPWFMDGQVAGFTVRFRAGDDTVRAGQQGRGQGRGQLRYASVKGAGHMVPQSKPAAALHLMRTFLEDGEL